MKHSIFTSAWLLLIMLFLCENARGGGRSGTDVAAPVEVQALAKPLGSGDGRIHVIPTLSAPSVKNGEKLTIQAVVKAAAGVAKVEAEIEGVTRLELRPASGMPGRSGASALVPISSMPSIGTLTPGGTVGLYQAEWTATGLEEKVYPVTLRVTDLAGHVYTDRSLSFSDPAAGNSTVGSPAYPMLRTGRLTMNAMENYIRSGVIDPTKGYAYFNISSKDGELIKIRLSDFTRVGTLPLYAYCECAVIDPVGGYAYFCPKKLSQNDA